MGNSTCNNKKRICEIISIIAINILLISGMAIYFPVIEENCERKIIERIEDIGYTTDSISLDEIEEFVPLQNLYSDVHWDNHSGSIETLKKNSL